MLVLGLESSCDETGAALISEEGLLADALHSQIDMHRAYGGVVPELASRDHIRRAVRLIDEVLERAGRRREDIDAIAVTEGPGLAGALLVGASVAHAAGWALGIPVIGVHHLEGHLLAARLADPAPEFPFLALLVSGGHTQIMRVESFGRYELLANKPVTTAGKLFTNYRTYPQGEIHAMLWNGMGMELLWKTRRIKGTVCDVTVADVDNNGKVDLVVAVNSYGGVTSGLKTRCAVYMYPLDTTKVNARPNYQE